MQIHTPLRSDNTYAFNHAVVVYGFTGSKGLWYGVDELICNFGWATEDFTGCVYVNNEVVADIPHVPSQVMTFDNYINLNVF